MQIVNSSFFNCGSGTNFKFQTPIVSSFVHIAQRIGTNILEAMFNPYEKLLSY